MRSMVSLSSNIQLDVYFTRSVLDPEKEEQSLPACLSQTPGSLKPSLPSVLNDSCSIYTASHAGM